jgi:hypothetical protein
MERGRREEIEERGEGAGGGEGGGQDGCGARQEGLGDGEGAKLAGDVQVAGEGGERGR